MPQVAANPFTGTFRAEPVPSTFAFGVRHSGTFTFRGVLPDVAATLRAAGTGFAMSENRIYVAAGTDGLLSVDASDRRNPKLIGKAPMPASADAVTVSGARGYVADRYSGLHILDLANPSEPALIGTFKVPGQALSVAALDNFALVAAGVALFEAVRQRRGGAPR